MNTELERLQAILLRLDSEIARLDKIIQLAQRGHAHDALAATLSAYNALVYVRDGEPTHSPLTADTVMKVLLSLDIPLVTDVYQASPDVFYASFVDALYPDHADTLKTVGFEVNTNARSPLKHRYMLTRIQEE